MNNTDIETVEPTQTYRTGFYGWYVIVVMMLLQALSTLDAKIPFILVEALKADLELSDTQIGAITGPAFTLVYAIVALPVAKISDRYSRKWVLSAATLVWGGLTAAGGAATGLTTFATSRFGVAIGEAATSPASHSIIAGYTTPLNRPKGMAIYALGSVVGGFLAFAAGGLVADRYGWRAALYLVGGLGLILALMVALTVREPERRPDGPSKNLPKGNLKSIFGSAPLRNIVIGGMFMGISHGAITSWGPAYVMRSFEFTATETGASFGAALAITGIIGMAVGGYGGAWLVKKGQGNAIKALAFAFVLAAIAQFASLFVNNYLLFLILMATSFLFIAFYYAPTYAAIQTLSDPSGRAFAAAVALFCINGVGISLSSFLAGMISDLLHPSFGDESLRWSLLALTCFKPFAAFFYYRAARAMDKLDVT